VFRPPQEVRPPHPENLAAGQPSTSHRLIFGITPRIAAKLRGWLGYLLGNLFLKRNDPKRSQSKGIADLSPLGQELEQLKKPPNRDRIKGVLGQGHQPKRHKVLIHDTQQEFRDKSSSKLRHENHQKEGRERQHQSLRNHAESSMHTMKVHTRSSFPPIHPSLSLDLT
jgi:hypothetical protein